MSLKPYTDITLDLVDRTVYITNLAEWLGRIDLKIHTTAEKVCDDHYTAGERRQFQDILNSLERTREQVAAELSQAEKTYLEKIKESAERRQ